MQQKLTCRRLPQEVKRRNGRSKKKGRKVNKGCFKNQVTTLGN